MTETAAMSSSLSSSCLATVFVDGMGFVAPPPLRHLSPVPSHNGRQYRPHARLRMVVGRTGAHAEGGYQEAWRMGRGEIWVRRKWVFYRRVVHANTHDFEAKKNPRQKSRDAAAWASFAPLPLHCRNRLWGIHIYAANSCAIGGGGGTTSQKCRAKHLAVCRSLFWPNFFYY